MKIKNLLNIKNLIHNQFVSGLLLIFVSVYANSIAHKLPKSTYLMF